MCVDVVGDREDSDWHLGNAVLIEVQDQSCPVCLHQGRDSWPCPWPNHLLCGPSS